MPGSYLIDVRRGTVFSRGWGVLTDAEIVGHAESLRSNVRFDPGFRQIVDFRDLSEMRATGAGVHAVAQNNPFRCDARRALMVVTDEAFGLARMFELFMEADAPRSSGSAWNKTPRGPLRRPTPPSKCRDVGRSRRHGGASALLRGRVAAAGRRRGRADTVR